MIVRTNSNLPIVSISTDGLRDALMGVVVSGGDEQVAAKEDKDPPAVLEGLVETPELRVLVTEGIKLALNSIELACALLMSI